MDRGLIKGVALFLKFNKRGEGLNKWGGRKSTFKTEKKSFIYSKTIQKKAYR